MTTRVVDAHVHVWDTDRFAVPWVIGSPLDRPALPAAIDDAEGLIDGWIFVEADVAATPLAEARWVAALGWDGLLAIVADIDLESARLRGDLEALRAEPLVRGVRHLLQDRAIGMLDTVVLGEGLRAAQSVGLVFDACVRWDQLDELALLLDRAPDAVVVLDHLGKPPLRHGLGSTEGRAWRAGLAAVARHPTVSVKLSGLRAEARSADELRDAGPAFLAAAVETFGPQRCLLGSDWPVSTGADAGLTTEHWTRMVREAVGEAQWPAVAAANALRVYGIS